MAVMTVAARSGPFLAFGCREAMDAGAVALGLVLMARRTGGGLRPDIIVGVLGGDVGVATSASIRLVHGSCQLGEIYKKGDFLAGGVGRSQRLIAMALKAGAVLDLLWRGQAGQSAAQHEDSCGRQGSR